MQPIQDYYERLAKDYDAQRFGNSYGRYIDHLERRILTTWLAQIPSSDVLDVGCGTGRLLDFAMTGVDPSGEMLKIASSKFPNRQFIQSSLPHLDNLIEGQYKAVTCFHVFMHLDTDSIAQSLQSLANLVTVGGFLILDIPSQYRRAYFPRRTSETGWHGDTAATHADIERWAGTRWSIVQRRGILFFPIHRIPHFARAAFRWLDALIGRTPLGRYSSYHVYQLKRRS